MVYAVAVLLLQKEVTFPLWPIFNFRLHFISDFETKLQFWWANFLFQNSKILRKVPPLRLQ